MFARLRRSWIPLALLCLAPAARSGVPVEDLAEAEELFARGGYDACLLLAEEGVVNDPTEERWHHLRVRAQLAIGEYDAARASAEAAVEAFSRDIHLPLLAHEVLLRCGDPAAAASMLTELRARAGSSWRYRDAESLVTRGRARLLDGEDVKDVMTTYFLPAKEKDSRSVSARVAIAEVALEKNDRALAADMVREGLELAPDDARLHLLSSRAFAPSDPAASGASLARALELNPNYAPALLLSADNALAGEAYSEVARLLDRVVAVDGKRWEAWAYRSVLAHLEGDASREKECRDKALARWPANPGVDHLIGRELSEKYRFAEGAVHQRQALEHDPRFEKARFQLAQDLLRLGEESEGWRLAERALDVDPYNVVAYNLMVLHDVLETYHTLEKDGFVVRMHAHEAEVYGQRVLDLLVEARDALVDKYEVELSTPTLVEIFAEQKDFAIRTFGLPGAHGFLGVCFGDVVTMQSPAAPGKTPTSWEATLWHEYCHVITLAKTKNKMPRWLSEGISVYEERLRDPAWGQDMNSAYRRRILDGRATPLSELSNAFLRPEGPLGLQFAYYESSLAVEYLVEEHGFPALLAILDDLGRGVPVKRALAKRAAPLDELDAAFDTFLRARASEFAKDATWEELEPGGEVAELLRFVDEHPRNVAALFAAAEALLADERSAEAVSMLERVLELTGGASEGSTYALLAACHAASGDVEAEIEALQRWAARDADSLVARERLMTLLEAREDWTALTAVARGAIAIQPMSAHAYRQWARAAVETKKPRDVVAAGRALLALDPVDPAQVHYLVARAALELGDQETARRNVLRALEEAPRFREAHSLLLEVVGEAPPSIKGGDH